MRQEFPGVRIDEGPRPFQIVQQGENGSAQLALRGCWRADSPAAAVHARLVREADQSVVIPWQSADRSHEHTWELTFPNVPVGGLYRVETRLVLDGTPPDWGLHGDVIHHIGVGDLWVIAGQSNAAGYGRGIVFDPPEPGIHVLKNNEEWDIAAHPLNDPTGSTHPNREIANPGHSPYLSFARRLREVLGYPVGLIQTALGNTRLSEWNPVENPAAPLFQNLIHCINLAGGRVRGLLWYQGESDTNPGLAETYERRFANFIEHLRTVLGAPRLQVILAQSNRYTGPQSPDEHRGWSILREAQRNAPKLGGIAVVPTLDLPLSDDCHTSPAGNLVLGRRKADAALAMVYGRNVEATYPDVIRAIRAIDGRSIEIHFQDVPTRLQFIAPGESDFTVEDEQGPADICSAQCSGPDRVILELSRSVSPSARVHSSFGANPAANLRDAETNAPILAFHGVSVVES